MTPALAATSVKVPSWLLWKRAACGGGDLASERVEGGSVDQVDVEPAVVVVVEQGDAGADGFDDEGFCRGPHVVGPGGKASFCGYVLEDDRARFYEAAGGDWAVLGVEDGGVGCSCGGTACLWLGLGLLDGLGLMRE